MPSLLLHPWLGPQTHGTFQVYTRVRPFLDGVDGVSPNASIVSMDHDTTTVRDAAGRTHSFKFTRCFDSSDPATEGCASQKDVYAVVGMGLLDNVFEGYNACLLAYGQTGSRLVPRPGASRAASCLFPAGRLLCPALCPVLWAWWWMVGIWCR